MGKGSGPGVLLAEVNLCELSSRFTAGTGRSATIAAVSSFASRRSELFSFAVLAAGEVRCPRADVDVLWLLLSPALLCQLVSA